MTLHLHTYCIMYTFNYFKLFLFLAAVAKIFEIVSIFLQERCQDAEAEVGRRGAGGDGGNCGSGGGGSGARGARGVSGGSGGVAAGPPCPQTLLQRRELLSATEAARAKGNKDWKSMPF